MGSSPSASVSGLFPLQTGSALAALQLTLGGPLCPLHVGNGVIVSVPSSSVVASLSLSSY